MTTTRWVWLGLGLTYAAFFGWYTSFGGPLTEDEIEHYLALFEAQGAAADPQMLARLEKFMKEDSGDDFVMINLIDLHETPLAVSGVSPGESSTEVLGRYLAFMYPALFARASHPVLFGSAAGGAMDLLHAEGMANWTSAAGMRYRSRRDMVEIASNPDFRGSHAFKIAAMRKTIAYPLDPWFHPGDPRLLLAMFFCLVGCAVSWWQAARAARAP